MTEPKTYKIRGEATSFDPQTARFEGEITVWFEDVTEPPPVEPGARNTRLSQSSVGARAYQPAASTPIPNPHPVYAKTARYAVDGRQGDINIGKPVDALTASYALRGLPADAYVSPSIDASSARYQWAGNVVDVKKNQRVAAGVSRTDWDGVAADVHNCVTAAWANAFNSAAFNRCTWNARVFGSRQVQARAASAFPRRWR